jgi:phosphate transport system substrate-binding protein
MNIRIDSIRRAQVDGLAWKLLCIALAASVGSVRAVAQSIIKVYGSDTMLVLNQQLTAEYARQHPNVRFEVVGGGSETGIAALQAGRTDIAAASRGMKESEFEAFQAAHRSRPKETVVALDGLAIYLHEYNPLRTLSMPRLTRILTGEIGNWREIGGSNAPITLYNRDLGSGTRKFVQETLLGKRSFAKSSVEVASTSRMAARVSTDPGGIGYGGVAYAKGVHIARIAVQDGEAGVWPSAENVASGKYPLSRSLYYYVNPASLRAEVVEFLDWVRSIDGQEIVTEVGYIAVPRQAVRPAAAVESGAPRQLDLQPSNLREHGFEVSVDLQPATGGQDDALVRVGVRFDTAGAAILRIRGVTLEIGTEAIVPLVLDSEFGAQFWVRTNHLARTTLRLDEAGAPLTGVTYLLRLADFDTRR